MISLMPAVFPNVNVGANAMEELASTSLLQVGDIAFAIQTSLSGAIPALAAGWTNIRGDGTSQTQCRVDDSSICVTLSVAARVSFVVVGPGNIGQSIDSLAGLWVVRNQPARRPLNAALASSPYSTAGLPKPVSVVHGSLGSPSPLINGVAPSATFSRTVSRSSLTPSFSVSITARLAFWPGDYSGQTITLSGAGSGDTAIVPVYGG